eukprot:scaffold647853_cov42-Prasinocladus_malaysianus.AAC.1
MPMASSVLNVRQARPLSVDVILSSEAGRWGKNDIWGFPPFGYSCGCGVAPYGTSTGLSNKVHLSLQMDICPVVA